MTTTKHKAYTQTVVSDLTTGINSLANVTNSSTFDIDNTSDKDLVADFELVLATQGGARSTGAYVSLHLTSALDATNYGDANEITAPAVAVWGLDAATTARRAVRFGIEVPPGLTRWFIRNVTGQAFAASGNTVKHRFRSYETT